MENQHDVVLEQSQLNVKTNVEAAAEALGLNNNNNTWGWWVVCCD